MKINTNKYKQVENNKFTLHVIEKREEKGDQTYMDSFFNNLRDTYISDQIIDKLEVYVKEELFDTDALIDDAADYRNKSNVVSVVDDSEAERLIRLEAVDYKSMFEFLQQPLILYITYIEFEIKNI